MVWQQSRVCGAVSEELDGKKGEKPCSHHISWAVPAVLLPRNGLFKTSTGRVVPSGAAMSEGRTTELPLGKGQRKIREGGAW